MRSPILRPSLLAVLVCACGPNADRFVVVTFTHPVTCPTAAALDPAYASAPGNYYLFELRRIDNTLRGARSFLFDPARVRVGRVGEDARATILVARTTATPFVVEPDGSYEGPAIRYLYKRFEDESASHFRQNFGYRPTRDDQPVWMSQTPAPFELRAGDCTADDLNVPDGI